MNPVVIGIGASAGGLEPLEKLFANVPRGSGAAFVVVQHLSPDFESHMGSILKRITDLAVCDIHDNVLLAADVIYLVPPGKQAELRGNRLRLYERPEKDVLNHPVNRFFSSLAAELGERSVGIILSGTGQDGVRGASEIHAAGGLVIVQDPQTAQFAGMPESAIATGQVDLILAPAAMGDALYRHAHNGLARQIPMVTTATDEAILSDLFALLKETKRVDFANYRSNTRTRRLQRRMHATGHDSLEDYYAFVQQDPKELERLFDEFLISVTRFFRDEQAFEYLQSEVLPGLIDQALLEDRPLRIWTPGCASGEEAYSLAIIIDEYLTQAGVALEWQIFATDVQAAVLATASAGVYQAGFVAEISPGRRREYFVADGNAFRVIDRLRENIIFAEHDVMADAPFNDIDLIACRNLLIYFNLRAQEQVLTALHFALRDEGVLFLGPSETTGTLSDAFVQLNRRWRFFNKVVDADVPLGVVASAMPRAAARGLESAVDAEALINAARSQSDELREGTALLVDGQFKLVEPLSEGANLLGLVDSDSNDLSARLIDELRSPGIAALETAARENKPVFHPGIKVVLDGGVLQSVDLLVRPMSGTSNLFLFCIDRAGVVARLGQDLMTARESLQTTGEELEAANEELQSTNEELVTSNEELQSTNEELQSVNEELYTVNTEYQQSIEDLVRANEDMENVLSSTGVGVVFLDAELNLRRYTPEFAKIFKLEPDQTGAAFTSIAQRAGMAEFIDVLRHIGATSEPFERAVSSPAGVPYMLRVAPYVSAGDDAGYVLTIVEISALVKARRRAEQFEHMSEQAADGHVFIDQNGHIEYANPTFAKISGYANAELQGEPVARLLPHFADSDGFGRALAQAWDSKLPIFDSILTRKDGGLVPIDITATAIKTGGAEKLFAVVRDISERKDANRQLSLLKHAIDVSQNGVSIAEAVQGLPLTYVNDGFLALTGYQRDEVIGRNCRFLQGPDSDPATIEKIHTAIEQQETVNVSVLNYRRDGSTFWNNLTISPVFNDQSRVTHFVGLQQDISAAIRLRLSDEQNARRTKAILESTAEGIYGLDPQGLCTFCNSSALQILGFDSEAEVVGRNMHELIHHTRSDGSHYPQEECQVAVGLQNGSSIRVDTEVLWRRDGTSFPAEYWSDPLIVDGEVVGVVVAFRDISSQKQYEQELLSARQAAEAANEAKSAFLANMSHEIRTPLAAVMGFTDVLRTQIQQPAQREQLDAIKRNASHLLDLINDILDLSKVEAGRLEIRKDTIELSEFLIELHSMMAQRAQEKDLEFDVRLNTPIPGLLETDPVRLRQILLNLLANAVKFTHEGSVRLELNYAEQSVDFAIVDTGVGIEAELQNKLFEPFEQGVSGEQFGGSGLGLSICKRLAEELGATIEVHSRLGQGSVFTLRHPARTLNDTGWISQEAISAGFGPSSAVADEDLARIEAHIVVADDQHDVREATQKILESAGATVTGARDGVEVIERYQQGCNAGEHYDLFILDIQMPKMTGYEAATELRRLGYRGKILALTARAMRGERERSEQAGCDDYLAKPVSSRKLTEAVYRLVSHEPDAPGGAGELSSLSVLVVEDHADTLNAYEALLTALGCEVRKATNGADALLELSGFVPDLCLLDQNLPDILGTELAQKLRELESCAGAGFAVVTGEVSPADVDRLLGQGFDFHIAKPVALPELQKVLEAVRDGRSSAIPTGDR